MKLIVREILDREKMSVRALAELMPEGGPSYRTIDEFIRRGGGTLATAAPIAKALGRGIDDIYVADDYVLPMDKHVTPAMAISQIVNMCIDENTDICEKLLTDIAIILGNNGFQKMS